MGAIFSYSLVSSIILILLYIAYKFTMAGERQFALNRTMIYAIYATALIAPIAYPAARSIQWSSPQATVVTIDVESNFGIISAVEKAAEQTPVWLQAILWIYIIGLVVATIRLIASVARIFLLARNKGNLRLDNGYILVLTDDRKFSPFSFMRYIVISREDYEKSKNEILIHEMTHLRKNHWIDQMVGNVIAIFLWYNPAAWLMIEELKSIHEYQADAAVIASGTDMRHYQYLLIEKAVGKRFPSPANSLNHSKLKKRVTMMYKSKPSRMRRLAGIAVIPAAIVALAITDIPAVADVISETESARLLAVSDSKVSNFSSDAQVVADETATEEPIRVIAVGSVKKGEEPLSVETMMVKVLDEMQVVAPANPDAKLSEERAEYSNKSDITYYVDGKETPAKIVEKLDPSSIESITVDKPDESNPKKGNVRITLKNNDPSKSNGTSNREVFVSVEQIPEYPGGMDELMKFLAQNIRYPEEAMKNNIQGRVIVKFIVTDDGSVVDPTIVKGVDQSLDQEALRVVNSMPKWKPGTVNGKPVSCYFTLPVNFRLQEDAKDSESAK